MHSSAKAVNPTAAAPTPKHTPVIASVMMYRLILMVFNDFYSIVIKVLVAGPLVGSGINRLCFRQGRARARATL